MGILAWIVVGLVAGWLAHAILGGRGGFFGNIAVGLVGAIVGGLIFNSLGIVPRGDFLGALVSATVGAIICLVIWRAIKRA
jgi:uncharacterized membrane protein YeaQ/YmgE (transglycosylase-associated protein family)